MKPKLEEMTHRIANMDQNAIPQKTKTKKQNNEIFFFFKKEKGTVRLYLMCDAPIMSIFRNLKESAGIVFPLNQLFQCLVLGADTCS